jgi:WD40 repeat protein
MVPCTGIRWRRAAGPVALLIGSVLLPLSADEPEKKSPVVKKPQDLKTASSQSTSSDEPIDFAPNAVSLPGVGSAVLALAIAPGGKTVATAHDDQTVQVHALPGGAVSFTLTGHADAVLALAFAADGKTLASGGADRLIKLWDPTTGKERLTLQGHTNWVHALSFSPDGKTLASASYDKTIRFWDAATGKLQATLTGH